MNIKKILAAGVLALGAIGLMAGCGGDQKSAGSAAKSAAAGAKPTKIVAGMDDTFAPMGFRDDSGKIVGFDIDMANAVSKEIGVPIEFKPIDWASKETELNSGKIDAIWNGFTMTPERQKKLGFTKPYMDNTQVYVVLADSPIKTQAELKVKKLDIQEASTAEAVLIEYYMTKKPGTFRELDGVVSKDTFAIGVKKDNQALIDLLNEGIEKVKASGEAAKISEKWFGKDVILK